MTTLETTYAPTGSDGGADDAAAGDSLTLPGLSAYDAFGREIRDEAFADCTVPKNPVMALAWAFGEIDALRDLVSRDYFVFTRENVADCLRHVMDGMAARS